MARPQDPDIKREAYLMAIETLKERHYEEYKALYREIKSQLFKEEMELLYRRRAAYREVRRELRRSSRKEKSDE